MKQLETNKHKFIMNLISFYKEIGIDMLITSEKIYTRSNFDISEYDNYKNKKNKEDTYKIKNKDKEIKELEYSFKNFDGCNLKKTATNFVKFLGNIDSKFLIIDGPPDIEEDRTGIPFLSVKGELFEKMLNAIKLSKNDVFIIKSIPWRPPGNRYPTIEELKICRPFILNLINLVKPKIIVCLGEVPTSQIFELDQSIMKLRGKWRLLQSKQISDSDHSNYDISVLPTLSITHLIERPDLKKYAWEDMKLFRDKIKEIS